MVDIGLWISYLLFIAAVLGMIVYSVVNMLRDTKKAKGTMVGVGLIAGLFLIAFLFSGNEVTAKYANFGISATQSKMIGAGILMTYILGIGTVVIAVYVEVRKVFMK